jgi:hypothetical protein
MHEVNMHVQESQKRCNSVRLWIKISKTGTQTSPISPTVITSKLPLLTETKEKTDKFIREKIHFTLTTMATEYGIGHNVIHGWKILDIRKCVPIGFLISRWRSKNIRKKCFLTSGRMVCCQRQ